VIIIYINNFNVFPYEGRGRRGRDRMVVRFTTTHAISAEETGGSGENHRPVASH
jgi:hypothetical protein